MKPNEGKQILVVDDDLELCHVIVDTLAEQGYRATYVETTEDALKKINAKVPDLILMDLEVPSMGGFVLCQKIHENPATQNIPIVFLSVRDSDIDKKTAMSLGADLYITKPFRRSVLLKEVETLLVRKTEETDVIGPSASHLQKIAEKAAPENPVEAQPEEPKQKAGSEEPASPNLKAVDLTAKKGFKHYFNAAAAVLGPMLKKIWAWSNLNKKAAIASGFALFLLLAGGSVSLFRYIATHGSQKAEKGGDGGEVSVNVVQAALAPFQDVLSNVGTIKGGSEIELRFQTEGNIRAINYHDGDAVRAGAVIAQLDQTQSSIKLDRAKQEYYRYEKLYALGGVSKDRLEEARGQLDFAQSEINKTILRANQDGIFGGKDASVGEFVTPQKKIGTMVSINSVVVSIGVIEKEIDKIFPGQRVIATVETYPNVEFKGKVETISPLIEGGAKTVEIQARIPNDGKLLLPGMFARTRIVVYEADSVMSVPNDAVEKTANGYQIYVVGADNKAEARPVEVSYVSLVNSVISKGLQPGEKVIIQKPQDLKAGTPVKVADVEKPVGEGAAADALGGAGEQKP